MEELNYKLAELRDTVKKIRKEIKSFQDKESIQKRTNTLNNKIFRHSSYSKKYPNNESNKRIMKKYFKLSLKEKSIQDYPNATNQNKNKYINGYDFKEIMTPQQLNKSNNRSKIRNSENNINYFNSKKNNRIITNTEKNSNDSNFYKKDYLSITDINNKNNKINIDSCMNQNLFKYMTARHKENSRYKKKINESQNNKNKMTYSNNDLKKYIFEDFFIKNINRKNKKKLLYNEYNNYNSINDNSSFVNNKKHLINRTKNISFSELLNINKKKSKYDKNIINNSLFQFNNNKLNIKKSKKMNVNKNNSFNYKITVNSNLNQINNHKDFEKSNQKLNIPKNDYYSKSYRPSIINNNVSYIPNSQKMPTKEYNSTQKYFNYNKKNKIVPINNTINYISNNNDDINIYNEENSQNNFNKNELKKIIGNYSIGDLYIKAKLFEKCGQKHFNSFVDNYCDSGDLISNLKNYKNYLEQIMEEENHYKKQINLCQKLCKRIFKLINRQKINDIIKEVQEKFFQNKEDNNFIIDELKSFIH